MRNLEFGMKGDWVTKGVLAVGALVCFITAYGYFSDAGIKPEVAAREEYYHVIDAAQVWIARPAIRGGGGGSFESIDFQKLGLADAPGALEWKGSSATYRIASRDRNAWVLEVRNSATGGVERTDTLQFDSYPGKR